MNDNEILLQQAMILFDRAYKHQIKGEYADAIALYERSIAIQPTAEAFTFLGWTYSMIELYHQAIDACTEAIEIDPGFGNPYNDIGAYLIELGRPEEAVSWLEKAILAPRYDSPHLPHLNLGRVYEELGDYQSALAYYDRALELSPLHLPAHWAKHLLLGKLN